MQGKRADRVGTLIKEELSHLILRSLKDPRIGFVTVTHVTVSADLRAAKVYVASQDRRALIGLKSAAGFLRGELARRLRLRYAPTLIFHPDDSVEEGLHLAELLRQIETGRRGEE